MGKSTEAAEIQHEHDASASPSGLKSLGGHFRDILGVLTVAIGTALAMGTVLIAVDFRSGGGHTLRALVYSFILGSLALFALGLRYVYPTLQSGKEKMLAWLTFALVSIIVGVFIGMAYFVQWIGIQFLGYRPTSWDELLAKGMVAAAAAGAATWRLGSLMSYLPQARTISKKGWLSLGILAFLPMLMLLLPAHIFPAIVAALFAMVCMFVFCLWIMRKKISAWMSKRLNIPSL